MPLKILFVCLGNICRSPMAHGLLRDYAEKQDLDILVDSCGTSNYHNGEAPDSRAQAKMREKGIDISDLSARSLTLKDFEIFDHILVMDSQNFENASTLAPDNESRKKVKRFLDYTGQEGLSVPDPYYGSDDGFEHVYQMLQAATKNLIKTA